jgi:hypothetical protein
MQNHRGSTTTDPYQEIHCNQAMHKFAEIKPSTSRKLFLVVFVKHAK